MNRHQGKVGQTQTQVTVWGMIPNYPVMTVRAIHQAVNKTIKQPRIWSLAMNGDL